MSFLKAGALVFLAVMTAAGQDEAIRLSSEQKLRMAAIKTDLEKKTAPIALHFAEVTKKIYQNMLRDSPDQQLRLRLGDEMKSDASNLLTLKGESIWATVGLLKSQQKARLRAEMSKPGAPADLTELIDKLFNH